MVATVLTVYGIETKDILDEVKEKVANVATVLTVYGIETLTNLPDKIASIVYSCNSTYRLRY